MKFQQKEANMSTDRVTGSSALGYWSGGSELMRNAKITCGEHVNAAVNLIFLWYVELGMFSNESEGVQTTIGCVQ